MKKLFSFAVLALTFALAGCTKDPAISVDEDVKMLYASAEGGVFTFTLNANREWIAEILPGSNATVTVDPDLGVGPQEVTLTVAENLSANTLETTVRFTCGTAPALASVDVTIKQAGLTSVTWGGVEYPVKKMKDGNFWFTQNLRYVPEGITPKTDFSANTGIWYPAKLLWDGTTASAEPSTEEPVITSQGMLYTAAACFGVETSAFPSTKFEDYTSTQGLCPNGWHVPTAQEWINLVGHCNDTDYSNKLAPYYDEDLKGASLNVLNADGFNLYPYPWVNGGTKYQAMVLNKSTEGDFVDYAGLSSMLYFLASTARSASQGYALQINNLKDKTIAAVGFNNYPNGCAVRCIKTKLNGTPL